ncbi:MAG: dipeptidase [Thermoleophilia bacterium]|nr:dipeptidase [Thermoleophilia bacterium]
MASPELFARAEALHREHPVVDCHSDLPIDLFRRRRAGEPDPLAGDWLGRLRAGGVRFAFLATGGDVPDDHDANGRPNLRALQLIDDVRAEADPHPGLRVVEWAEDVGTVIASGEVGLVLHLEGLRPLVGRLDSVRHFHRLGVRSAQLTWNGANELADGVGVSRPGGLTPLGREVVAELDRQAILIDVSHLAEPGFWELVALARGPLVASHANAAAICPHPRNLSDDQIRAIAESGGYIGVCFVSAFIGDPAGLERLLDHVDHIAGLAGVDAVAVGPDHADYLEGDDDVPEELRRVETLPAFTAGLLGRGYTEAEAAKIVGGNALRVLRRTLPPA